MKVLIKKHFIAVLAVVAGTFGTPVPSAAQIDILNATSFQSSLSPGVVAVIFGESITPSNQVGCAFSEQVGWGNSLGGVEVLVNDKLAPIGAHCRIPQSDGLIAEVLTCQFPRDLAPGEAEVVVRVNNLAAESLAVTLQSHAPALAEYVTVSGLRLGAFQHVPSGELISSENLATPGEVLSIFANGLGPTDPYVAEGQVTPNPAPSTLATPLVTVDGEAVEVLTSTLRPDFVGVHVVTFRVPAFLETGYHRVRLAVEGIASNEVLLAAGEPTEPFVRSIVSAASFTPNLPAAPGSILSLFVSNLEGGENSNLFPAIEFEGISVEFNGTSAPLFGVAAQLGQLNVLAPLELPETGEVEVRIVTPGGGSGSYVLPLTSASPGIFRILDPADPNRRFAAATLANTAWLAIPDSVSQALDLPIDCAEQGINPASYCGHPIRPGQTIQLFVTGLGRATPNGDPTSPPLETGQVAPADGNPLYRTVALPEVLIGDLPAVVAFSGLAPGFAGLYQINAVVPLGAPSGDAVSVRVSTANGLSDAAPIAVEGP